MSQFFLYNTLSRRVEEFKPIKKGHAGIYACGPTVYNYAHIGNLRAYVFEDVLKRALTRNNYKVKHVMNITDVGHLTSDADEGEDKMEKGAQREGKSAWKIADFYIKAFCEDLRSLDIIEPDIWCRATDHIKEQISLIKKLEKKGYVYKTVDGIYFDTSKFKDYGKLAMLKKEELRGGVRVEIGDKKNITDFALWKFSPKLQQRQMEWPSPWGVGFPGWHIECSAMSAKYLGQPFDVHCGGVDHIAVHHTNEIAQSEAANDKPLANYWMHGEFLLMNGGEKMAKSTENFITLQTLKIKNFSPIAYRYFLLQTHYRKQLNFSWEALQAAQNGLKRLYNITRGLNTDSGGAIVEYENKFTKIINNDLDTPNALALMWDMVRNEKYPPSARRQTLFKFDEVFGLRLKEESEKKEEPLPAKIKTLVAERDEARKNKDWKKSDEIRKKMEEMGYAVGDTGNGTGVKKWQAIE